MKNRIVELTLGDKICFVIKPTFDLVCDAIIRGNLSKKFGGLEYSSVYVLVADNKFDFYNIVEIAKIKYKNLDTVLKYNSKKSIHNSSVSTLLDI